LTPNIEFEYQDSEGSSSIPIAPQGAAVTKTKSTAAGIRGKDRTVVAFLLFLSEEDRVSDSVSGADGFRVYQKRCRE
jgi:hypothetical protein